MSQNCILKVLLAILSPHRRTNVAWMSRYWPLCSNATFKLFLHFLTLVNSNFWCANRILRQAEFQNCITLPHWRPYASYRNLEKLKLLFQGIGPPPDFWSQAGNLCTSRLNLKFKILTKPGFRISTKIQLHHLYKTSATKYWPNSNFKSCLNFNFKILTKPFQGSQRRGYYVF